MYCKVPVLRALDPTAKFIHIVRDPRSVVASYLFGKNQKNRPKYDTPEAFFGRSTNRLSWSCGRFSDLLLARPENAHLREIPDFMRIMLVWKFTFERAWADGRTAFGPNYRLLRHEDLANDPVGTVESLYAFLEKPVSPTALAWATANLRPAGELFAPEHAAWQRAIDALDLQPLLTAAGYHGQVDHSDRLITHAA
jgi:hypothetical protein